MNNLDPVRVGLRPIVNNINLPTVLKTAVLPGDNMESLFIATQVGEIFYIRDRFIGTFLDIRSRIISLGTSGRGYDERGLLGLAFHPQFYYNGLFYIHYSVAGSQGPGALSGGFSPDPCDPETLNLKWTNRTVQYDHIDTVEEWIFALNGGPQKLRTLLNLRRPFANHNGVNSLNFSPETGKMVLTTGDGGSGFDPFNLSQDDMEIAGKIIEIDVNLNAYSNSYNKDIPVVTRFDELPLQTQGILTVIAKGVRNIPGISYQRFNNRYFKYVGNVGQDMVESIFSFDNYIPVPVTQLIQAGNDNFNLNFKGFVNLGWRGWEGNLPTSIIRRCPENSALNEKIMAYYNEAIATSVLRLPPLTCYYHEDPRLGKINGTALTGIQPYMGTGIPSLSGKILFTDFVNRGSTGTPARGALAYTEVRSDCSLNDYRVIDIDYDFGSRAAYYVSLGTNMDQTRIFLGVYGSANVTDFNQGSVFDLFCSHRLIHR